MTFLAASPRRTVLEHRFAASAQEQHVNVPTLAGYVAGATDVYVKVDPSVYLWSGNTAVAGLKITAAAGDRVFLVNSGYILGRGGNGASANSGSVTSPTAGGPALELVDCECVIDTASGYIAGGGGGGAGAIADFGGGDVRGWVGGGGGAGGGTGGSVSGSTVVDGFSSFSGGTGGAIGASGGAGGQPPSGSVYYGAGGGGGRIVPGSSAVWPDGGPAPGGQAGGAGGAETRFLVGPGVRHAAAGGGGGGWGAAGGDSYVHLDNDAAAGGTGGGGSSDGGDGTLTVGPSTLYQSGAAGGKAIKLTGTASRTIATGGSRILGATS